MPPPGPAFATETNMVPVQSLIVPILVSAVVVFVASSIMHMLLKYHKNDMLKVEKEDELLDALRRLNIPPGDYGAPHPGSMEGMKKPEFIEKTTKGPLVLMTLSPGAPPGFGKNLIQCFLYSVVVSLFSGYLAASPVGPARPSLQL